MMNDELMEHITFGFGAMLGAYVMARVDGKPRDALLLASIESFADTKFKRDELEYMLALAIDQLAQRIVETREAAS